MLWHGRPGLFSHVLGRSLPVALSTMVLCGAPLLGLVDEISLAGWIRALESPWFWVGVAGLPGPFLFNLMEWVATRYVLTENALHILRPLGSRSIPRRYILEVDWDREGVDHLYPKPYASLLVVVEQSRESPLPLVADVLTLRGIRSAARVAERFRPPDTFRRVG